MTDPAASIVANANGGDLFLLKSDVPGNSIFFHTYGFSGVNTYFGARASGSGQFLGATSANYHATFTNTTATAQLFDFTLNP